MEEKLADVCRRCWRFLAWTPLGTWQFLLELGLGYHTDAASAWYLWPADSADVVPIQYPHPWAGPGTVPVGRVNFWLNSQQLNWTNCYRPCTFKARLSGNDCNYQLITLINSVQSNGCKQISWQPNWNQHFLQHMKKIMATTPTQMTRKYRFFSITM